MRVTAALLLLAGCAAPPVYWSSSKPDPYHWTSLAVEIGSFSDPSSCRRARLREHDQRYQSRWVMYYQIIPEYLQRDEQDPRAIAIDLTTAAFVVKLYANREDMPLHSDLPSERVARSMQMLSDELVWLLRPCPGEATSLFYKSVWPTGVPEPLHLKGAP